jgi:hypothetical protein
VLDGGCPLDMGSTPGQIGCRDRFPNDATSVILGLPLGDRREELMAEYFRNRLFFRSWVGRSPLGFQQLAHSISNWKVLMALGIPWQETSAHDDEATRCKLSSAPSVVISDDERLKRDLIMSETSIVELISVRAGIKRYDSNH